MKRETFDMAITEKAHSTYQCIYNSSALNYLSLSLFKNVCFEILL